MRKYLPVFGASLLLPVSGPAALAQESDPNALVLEEILVTASRRVERLQEVGMSVSAFGSDFLQGTGVNQLTDLEQYTPNLKITPSTDSNGTSYRIRGIGSVGTNSGIDPSVGMFIDGVYQGRAGMSISDLIDVERIEVLRGPQGTLYGKNTAAGAISIITKQPTNEFEYLAEAGYDSEERMELRGMVNVPLGDSGHAMRLSAYGIDGDHMYRNTYTGKGINDANKYGGRARLLFNFEGDTTTDGFGQFIASLDYSKEDTDCCALATITYEGLSTLNSPITSTPSAQWQEMLGNNALGQPILRFNDFETAEGFSPPEADPFGDDYWFNADLGNEVDVGGAALEWNRDLESGSTLTFINAWRFYESLSMFDGDFTAYDASRTTTDIDLDQYSSELRITSEGGETIDYQAGLYAYRSTLDSQGDFEQREDLLEKIVLFGDITMADFSPGGSTNIDTNEYTTTSYAAFGQAVWNITEAFSTTLGLRYTYEKKERVGTQITTPSVPFDTPPIAGPDIAYDDDRSDTALSPSLNFRYFFNPDVMGYAMVSRGFKSGGYDQRRQALGETGEFDEEISTSYELGWKTSWGNRRVQFNGALFFVDYEDFQAQSFDGASLKVTNAGDMESYGAELEFTYLPTTNVIFGSALGYNKAEYKSFDNGQCTVQQSFEQYYIIEGAQGGTPGTASVCLQDLAGQPIDNAPEWTISSYIQYDHEMGSDLVGTARLEHSYTDSYFLDQDLDPNLENDSVNLINLRLTLSNQARTWEAILWGRNLLDEEYYSWGIDAPTVGGYAGVVAPGSTYGVTLRMMN
ncbi:TonB-dependent receptor [Halioglobus sp. HI00S01]|uniref:TonB-dependent receptor n=1 Tax=Halioglobus sp. HI00S01 TaxID=1822214 RepID=UPI0012E7E9D0|nr:TonB-dependent receptor [Halioglobus sp. HI00S01]